MHNIKQAKPGYVLQMTKKKYVNIFISYSSIQKQSTDNFSSLWLRELVEAVENDSMMLLQQWVLKVIMDELPAFEFP